MRRAAAALACTLLSGPSAAVAVTAHAGALVSVANVDVMPGRTADGFRILEAYVAQASRDPAVGFLLLLRQEGSPNHFVLTQGFADRAAYDAHADSGYVRGFRDALFPVLASPYDERLERDVTDDTSQIAKPASDSRAPTAPVDDHP